MKKLLKTYGLTEVQEYYEMIVESFLNGQHSQAREQFCAMPKAQRVEFVQLSLSTWESGLGQHKIVGLIELI